MFMIIIKLLFFSELLNESLDTIQYICCEKKKQIIKKDIQKNIYVKADPIAISRVTK